jgi:hypothetical protein
MPANPLPVKRQTPNIKPASSPIVVQQSLQTKQSIINELVARRLELPEAASRFQAVHATSSARIERATGVRIKSTNHEDLYRTLIGWVHLSLCGNRPERATDRLERELQVQLDQCGKVNALLV